MDDGAGRGEGGGRVRLDGSAHRSRWSVGVVKVFRYGGGDGMRGLLRGRGEGQATHRRGGGREEGGAEGPNVYMRTHDWRGSIVRSIYVGASVCVSYVFPTPELTPVGRAVSETWGLTNWVLLGLVQCGFSAEHIWSMA